jgi:hypothetical protein
VLLLLEYRGLLLCCWKCGCSCQLLRAHRGSRASSHIATPVTADTAATEMKAKRQPCMPRIRRPAMFVAYTLLSIAPMLPAARRCIAARREVAQGTC